MTDRLFVYQEKFGSRLSLSPCPNIFKALYKFIYRTLHNFIFKSLAFNIFDYRALQFIVIQIQCKNIAIFFAFAISYQQILYSPKLQTLHNSITYTNFKQAQIEHAVFESHKVSQTEKLKMPCVIVHQSLFALVPVSMCIIFGLYTTIKTSKFFRMVLKI